MNVSTLPSLQHLRAYSAAQNAIVIANTQPIIELRGQINDLSSAQVDAILIALDGNGLNGGTVDLSGQTPIAPPTAAGLAAMANLIGKGWTVTVDQPTWAPATEIGTWADSGGPAFGNLAAFQAGADMATVSQLTFAATGNLTSLTGLQGLPVLATLDVNTNILTTLDVSGLTSLATLNCSSNASLTTLTLTGCTALTTLDASFCPALTGITGDVTCTSLASISISNSGVLSLTLGGAANMTQIDMTFSAITSFIANSLQTVTGDILMDATPMTTISLPNLTSVGNQIALTNTPFAGTLSFPALISTGSALTDFVGNASLVVFDAQNLVTISGSVTFSNCTSLTDVKLNSYLPSVGANVGLFNCALTTTYIDPIEYDWVHGFDPLDLTCSSNIFSIRAWPSRNPSSLTEIALSSPGADCNARTADSSLSIRMSVLLARLSASLMCDSRPLLPLVSILSTLLSVAVISVFIEASVLPWSMIVRMHHCEMNTMMARIVASNTLYTIPMRAFTLSFIIITSLSF